MRRQARAPAARVALRTLATLACAVALAACSGARKPPPSPLQPYAAEATLRLAWQQRIAPVSFPLVVAVNGGASGATYTVAGGDGTVLALDAASGRELWRASARAKIAAGVGSDGRFAAVVTVDNELVVLEAGREAWRQRLPARVASAPLVAGERVFAMGVDRVVHAFDAVDGRRLWTLQRPGEPLTLSLPGVVAPFKDTLLVGQGPRLAGVDPTTGALRWEVAVAAPRGTNEVERLADLVGPAGRVGDVVCARAFQAAVGCVDAERGTLLWSRPGGGNDAVSADPALVVGADASDRVTAWRFASGDTAWTTDRLLHRDLSAPAAAERGIVFGDVAGRGAPAFPRRRPHPRAPGHRRRPGRRPAGARRLDAARRHPFGRAARPARRVTGHHGAGTIPAGRKERP